MIKKINSLEEYKSTYKKSIENPEQFWGEVAENFTWNQNVGFALRINLFQ
jgi:acetyl-CoA synthetase